MFADIKKRTGLSCKMADGEEIRAASGCIRIVDCGEYTKVLASGDNIDAIMVALDLNDDKKKGSDEELKYNYKPLKSAPSNETFDKRVDGDGLEFKMQFKTTATFNAAAILAELHEREAKCTNINIEWGA